MFVSLAGSAADPGKMTGSFPFSFVLSKHMQTEHKIHDLHVSITIFLALLLSSLLLPSTLGAGS